MPVPAAYLRLYDARVFTAEEAARALNKTGPQLHQTLHSLAEGGYVERVRRGLFAIREPGELESGRATAVNPYLLASKLTAPYALAYHTALEMHGVAHSSYHAVHVASPKNFRGFEHRGVTYRHVRASAREVERSTETHKVEGQPVSVTTREWTLAHCALRPELAGGFEEILQSLRGFSSMRASAVLEAARFLRVKTLYNRAGFLLWANRERWHVTEEDLAPFKRGLSEHVHYFGTSKGQGRFVPEWRVMIPQSAQGVVSLGQE